MKLHVGVHSPRNHTTSKSMAITCTMQKNTEAIADSFKPSTQRQAKKATMIKAEISMSLPGQHDFKYDMADTADTTQVVAYDRNDKLPAAAAIILLDDVLMMAV